MSPHPPKVEFNGASCPLPLSDYPQVLAAHGGGGKLTRQLIEKLFLQAFDNPFLNTRHDGAVVVAQGRRQAFTTDSYVIQPLFFPGGDIGSLAVNGTVNDLAMCGARPAFLSAGFILEEGLAMDTLWRVVQSMRRAADAAGVVLVTGDTKVVERGKGDGVFINTAGIGWIEHDLDIGPSGIRPGDSIVLSGDIGRHGMAIMGVREGLSFENPIASDCAPLVEPVLGLLDSGIGVHCLRDLTRGGLTGALVELAQTAGTDFHIDETAVPVREEVRGACEILGLDPFHVANEGRFIAFVAQEDAAPTLDVLNKIDPGAARIIGQVEPTGDGKALLKSSLGARRILDLLAGDPLPRIC